MTIESSCSTAPPMRPPACWPEKYGGMESRMRVRRWTKGDEAGARAATADDVPVLRDLEEAFLGLDEEDAGGRDMA